MTFLLFLGSRSYADFLLLQVPAATSKIPLLVFQGSLPSRVALIHVNFSLLWTHTWSTAERWLMTWVYLFSNHNWCPASSTENVLLLPGLVHAPCFYSLGQWKRRVFRNVYSYLTLSWHSIHDRCIFFP